MKHVPYSTSAVTDALGQSEAFLTFQEHLNMAADSERPVLVLGERGSGKELAAQRLHYMSRRWEKPCITLLCSALNPNLLEAELFGVEPGAYTGARERRAGFFERADQGTLFLDEVADMPLPLQDKLLRVLEYGTFERVGGERSLHADIRIVAATNRDIRGMARVGSFREDLLDRLACEVVHVPPLRERGNDIVLLALHFANRLAVELGFDWLHEVSEGVSFSPSALEELQRWSWPGNVRELRNTVERSLLRSRRPVIDRLVLDAFVSPWGDHAATGARFSGPSGAYGLGEAYDPDEPSCLSEFSCPGESSGQGGFNGLARVGKAGTTHGDTPPATVKPDILPVDTIIPSNFSLPDAIRELELRSLKAALRAARYRQTDAARLLGISYHQFRALYRKHRPESRRGIRSESGQGAGQNLKKAAIDTSGMAD